MRDSITIGQFRSIVLGNFLFKVSSKILADRDRHVEDCIALASDCVNVLHKKCYGGNVAIKINTRKAFDTLDWKFLCRVLRAFGFSQTFMDWIVSILGSSRLSIFINGSPAGYFGCTRGVRQEDPFSSLLFGIAEDFLSRLLSRMVASDQLLPISSPRGFSAPTHLLYADDVLIFCRGTVRNLRRVMHAFRVYGSISGQLVNWSKSSISFGSLVSLARISSLQSLVGMQIGRLPFYYLGVPLFQGKPMKSVLMPIADKILSKFAKWKGKSLSLAGRATLIRSMITGSFVYSFMMVTKKIRNFLWTGSCEETKLVRVAWNRCCRPYALGGLGLKDLAMLNNSLLRKLTWKFITANNFAFTFLRKRYFRQLQKPHGGYITSSIWNSFRTNHVELIKDGIWLIGENSQRDFWLDNWLGMPILNLLGIPDFLATHLQAKVSDFIRDGKWILDDHFRARFPDLCFRIGRITISPVIDYLVWPQAREGSVSCKAAYSWMFHDIPQVFAFEAELIGASLAINYAWNLGLIRLPGVFVKLGSAAFIRSCIWSSRFLIYSGKVIKWQMLSLNTLWVFLLIPDGLPLFRYVLRLLVMTVWV
ncbi:hypothetical protein Dsin_017514 [Dipteronia sinensis]|uniref:Reverse transcriptase domain-containing protein n=1 Tax=Dipteronia sinensis TaxID=43782 RepID=A0AAE0AFU3_9ROSI|nr:hypothetical protein Dsin_017514 [Dipteronia sinensis]